MSLSQQAKVRAAATRAITSADHPQLSTLLPPAPEPIISAVQQGSPELPATAQPAPVQTIDHTSTAVFPSAEPVGQPALYSAMLAVPARLGGHVVGLAGEVLVPTFDLNTAKHRYGLTRRLAGTVSASTFDRLTRACRPHLSLRKPSTYQLESVGRPIPPMPPPPPALSPAAMLALLATESIPGAAASAVAPTTPLTHAQAMGDVNWEAWQAAVQTELKSMDDFAVWELVPPPPGCRPLGNK